VDTSAATYTYDALGRRVISVIGGNTFYSGYDLGSRLVWEFEGSTYYRGEVYGGKGKLATYKAGLTFFPTQDLVGTVRNNVTQDAGYTESCATLPFGDGLRCWGNASGLPGPALFTGLDRDSESTLDHTLFRQYSSNQGRWMRPDPAGMAAVDVTNPQTWNRYAYVGNNPLSFVDPSGLNRAGPGGCNDGNGICPDEGGGADPTSIDNGNGGTDFSAIGNSASDCPICSGPYGAFGTSGIYGGYFGAGQVWGGSTSGGYAASYFQGPEAEDDEDYLDELQELLNNGLEPLDMDNVWRCVGCIYPNQPGPLSGRAANAFRWYIPVTANTPTTYYRYWGPPAQLTGVDGTWYSFFAPEGSQEFFRDQMSLSPQWNSMQNLDEVEIPAGTTVYIGPAAAQGPYSGGGLQVYVPNP
jgi:RHS repeat-associated protein